MGCVPAPVVRTLQTGRTAWMLRCVRGRELGKGRGGGASAGDLETYEIVDTCMWVNAMPAFVGRQAQVTTRAASEAVGNPQILNSDGSRHRL